MLQGTSTRFEECSDVSIGGVLCALPALTVNGLFDHLQKNFPVLDRTIAIRIARRIGQPSGTRSCAGSPLPAIQGRCQFCGEGDVRTACVQRGGGNDGARFRHGGGSIKHGVDDVEKRQRVYDRYTAQ